MKPSKQLNRRAEYFVQRIFFAIQRLFRMMKLCNVLESLEQLTS